SGSRVPGSKISGPNPGPGSCAAGGTPRRFSRVRPSCKPSMARLLLECRQTHSRTVRRETSMTRIGTSILLTLALSAPALAQEPIKIGLVTALSGQSARAGEAITRGVTVAIDELNAKGGVLKGRKLELVRRDDEATPAKGVTAARELLFKEKVAVLFGGLDTPVSLAIGAIVKQEKIPFMGPWAAGTPITKNGANPNYVFRVSAVDEIVNRAMLQYGQKTFNGKNCGMILVNNPWGESNVKGLMAALGAKGLKPAGVEKF